jgi:hypothetical protein
MPKPPRADRPIEKTLSLPTSIVAKVDLLLLSEVEMKVPHGAWRDYVVALIEQDLQRRAAHVQQQRAA